MARVGVATPTAPHDAEGMGHGWRSSIGPGRAGRLVVAMLLVLSVGGTARADDGPQIVSGPTLTGMTREGATLTATATYTGTPTPVASWSWLRCTGRGASTCTEIPGAQGDTYVLTAADVAKRIRVRLTIRNDAGQDEGMSSATEVVEAAVTPT